MQKNLALITEIKNVMKQTLDSVDVDLLFEEEEEMVRCTLQ